MSTHDEIARRFSSRLLPASVWPALALLVLSAAAPRWARAADDVVAASSVPGSDEARAEELIERGAELRRTDQDVEALALFRRALELTPESSRAQAHLGSTYQALGRWVLANTFLSQALAQTEDPYVGRHRAALEQALEFVRDHLGLLEVSGGPAGAEVLLNGQVVGTLPMPEPAPVPVGAYQMEVALAGHYGVNLPVRISRRALTREMVELLPLSVAARKSGSDSGAGAATAGAVGLEPGAGPRWLPWTLAGTGAAAAAFSTVALIQRQKHADRWNDDDECLNVPGATRRSLCGDERSLGLRWQTTAIVSGGAAVALATAAIWTALASDDTPAEADVGLQRCSVDGVGVSCIGRF
ncbi:MAG: hypothetical protein RL685_2148 [Pseudomonadota bacterium]|jgi:tetratricopeptide (TPR) repeat protein